MNRFAPQGVTMLETRIAPRRDLTRFDLASGLPGGGNRLALPALPAGMAAALLARRIELEVDACELFEAQLRGTAPPLIDARTPRAWRSGHIAGATNLPAARVDEDALARFAAAEFVLVYGSDDLRLDGVRTARAVADLGVRVKLLNGGFAAWTDEGFPVEQAPAPVGLIAAI